MSTASTATGLPADARDTESLLADIERIESFLNGTEPVRAADATAADAAAAGGDAGATIPCASSDDVTILIGGTYC
ncbi:MULTISPECIES: hypothetical protein [Kitasatospora]|uniref:Uncharacterized protein n=1 Tax=Kitasatospora setae (strain ATCC 33774 / DSM 43861 / JCM 3304 / KCC A-0304 / NBRC 14216 / KM-6054) TaxID=452652 RepID=E4N311_KITSK|nr:MULTISPECIES: hypothetical protein [Kitasatospora]BAJ32545.1 hypothetical protein KSE_67870 [Kitasatospora setae KM-6054]